MSTSILPDSGKDKLEILEFVVGGNRYGIDVSKIEEIIGECEVQKVPNTKPNVEGIFRRRGKIYTVIDLAGYLGLEGHHTKNIYLTTYINQTYAAFRVDEICMIHHLCQSDIQEPDRLLNGEDSVITGIAKMDHNEMILILDFERILFDINPEVGIDEEAAGRVHKESHAEVPILIAEDSVLLRKMIVESLSKAGFEKITATVNGQEAWDTLQTWKGDDLDKKVPCIITDIKMPQMDGLELTKKIKGDAELQKIPIIVFSSVIDNTTKQQCIQAGANAQLAKPDIVKLVTCVDKLMQL